jgi:hypothetical protein
MSEDGFGCFGKFVVDVKDRMENVAGDVECIAWCG